MFIKHKTFEKLKNIFNFKYALSKTHNYQLIKVFHIYIYNDHINILSIDNF